MARSIVSRTRLAAFALAAVTALGAGVAAGPTAAHADDPSGPPAFSYDAYHLTKLDTGKTIPAYGGLVIPQTGFDFTLTVGTAEVAPAPGADDGGHHIRIVLPDDYYSNPTKRYPVLYLLHGSGTGVDPAGEFSPYQDVNSHEGMIFVMPDGGARGWYTNWLMQNTQAGAQNWENFHIDQVIPFIDGNLRTIADRQHRSIAGFSMGGLGALRYAEHHPDLFSQAASMSGDNDLGRMSMDLRMAVVASLQINDPYLVSSDAVFGSPYPVSWTWPYDDSLWNDASPGTHAAALAGMDVSVYTGNGGGGSTPPTTTLGGFLEWWLPGAARWFGHDAAAVGVPTHMVQYGSGTGTGTKWDVPGCTGMHAQIACWNVDVTDVVARARAHFAGQALSTTAPITVGTQSLCLDVRGANDSSGTPVQVYTCNGTGAQSWTADTSHTIQALGRCLTVPGGATAAAGTAVDIADCDGTGAQQWLPQADGTLLNPASGRCLADAAGGAAGTQVVIADCGTGAEQQWKVPVIGT